jgi:hypothetical protein
LSGDAAQQLVERTKKEIALLTEITHHIAGPLGSPQELMKWKDAHPELADSAAGPPVQGSAGTVPRQPDTSIADSDETFVESDFMLNESSTALVPASITQRPVASGRNSAGGQSMKPPVASHARRTVRAAPDGMRFGSLHAGPVEESPSMSQPYRAEQFYTSSTLEGSRSFAEPASRCSINTRHDSLYTASIAMGRRRQGGAVEIVDESRFDVAGWCSAGGCIAS